MICRWQIVQSLIRLIDNVSIKLGAFLEKREQERQEVSLFVEVFDPPHLGKVQLRTRDLSKKGAFLLVKKEQCLPVGRVLSLRMPGILWGEDTSTITARVVRVTEEGMGLQFLDFDF